MTTTSRKARRTATTTSTTRTISRKKKTSTSDRGLRDLLRSFESVVVAYSGGVDSAYVAWAATQVLGPAALCVTADSPSYADHHRQLAHRIALEHGFRHEIVRTAELENPAYRANPANRCYHCKHELYTTLSRLAQARGFAVIADGSNADDRGDYRPGRQAAREFGVRSPLDEVGLTKAEIRVLARDAGLPWDEPASACLSSRIPYHSGVTDAKLRMIEQAEDALREMGFPICRVRHHDLQEPGAPMVPAADRPYVPEGEPEVPARARVEIGRDDLARALDPLLRHRITSALLAIGYSDVAIDPKGYRMGSLNEGLVLRPVPSSR